MNNVNGGALPRSFYRRGVSPFSSVSLLGRPFSNLIDDLINGNIEPVGFSDKESFVPRIEASEDENRLLLKAEVPGLKEEDVEITLTKKELRLKGERKQHCEHSEGKVCRSEWAYGSFERIIPLSFEVDEDNVEATFKDGILSISLPKSRKAISETKKVSIKRI